MTPARDSAGEGGLTASVARNLGVALTFVLASALAFWGAGQIGAGADDIEVVAAPDDGEGAGDPTGDGTEPVTTPTAVETTPTAESPTTEAATEEHGANEATETDTPVEAEPTEDDDEPAGTDARIPPSEISIQILDAVVEDDNATARAVADELESAGYRVVVVNDSYRVYDTTTVFYTPGSEAAARQLADEYGFTRVELKPDNLSDSVDIHLVVGRDRA